MSMAQHLAEITDQQFADISELVKRLTGINLHAGKKELVKARLAKRTRQLKLGSLEEYIGFVRNDKSGRELVSMLDALSTNLTFFFREPAHFNFLKDRILPDIKGRNTKRLRIWSAGCSSGEEPYSIAILLNECIPDLDRWDAKILATDLSTRVLSIAMRGEYAKQRFRDTPGQLVQRYFDVVQTSPSKIYRTGPRIRKIVHFARLNLVEPWPMKGPFDVMFCRNVMIYFDKPTQNRLVKRYYDLLAPGGHLFLGHSESLTGTKHQFRYVMPATYVK
ncbi:MAG: chemotaxis protein CheR [Planctomycetes bacterium]|jgi:chemotaxis protein methyltransferase CheR|nr:protein-glutamate O-methyltransferase CheR [Phycisphaerae bacterium]NBB95534.1 chemotaxis protein CheR [Planctomycetota bacterium]